MKLAIQNFLEIRDSVVDIDDTYTLVYGENTTSTGASSNGAGKSLLLESIFFALFGDSLRGFKLSDLVGPFGDNAVVDLTIGSLRVVRSRGKSKSSVSVWIDGEQRQYQEIKYAQEDIDRWLGSNQTHFLVSSYFGEQAEHILDMTPANRTKKLLDIVRYDSAEHQRIDTAVKARIAELEKQLIRVDTQYFGIDELEAASKANLDSAQYSICSKIMQARTGVDSIRGEIEVLEAKLKESVAVFDDSAKSIELAEATEGMELAKSKVVAAEQQLETVELNIRLREQKNSQLLLDEAKECSEISEPLDKKLVELEGKLKVIGANGKLKSASRDEKLKRIEAAEAKLRHDSASCSDSSCPECGQRLVNVDAAKRIEESIRRSESLIQLERNELEVTIREIEELRRDRDVVKADIASAEATRADVEARVEAARSVWVERIDANQRELQALRDNRESIRRELTEVRAEAVRHGEAIKALKAEFAAAEAVVTASKRGKERLAELKLELMKRTDRVASVEAELAEFEASRLKSIAAIEAEFLEKREKLIVERSAIEKSAATLGEFRSSIAKFKNVIISRFIEKLESRLNYFFLEINSDLYADFSMDGDELNIAFSDASKSKLLPYKMFSRGERTRLRKAFFWLMVDLFQPKIVLSDESVDGVDEFGVTHIATFSAKENANRLYLEASPLRLEFESEGDLQTVICKKFTEHDGSTVISIGVE